MVSDELVRLLAAAKDDPELQSALDTAATPDEVLRIAADRGISLSTDDLPSVDAGAVDVSDAELASAAGGTNAAWYWATAPDFCATNGRLCTFYAPYCTPG